MSTPIEFFWCHLNNLNEAESSVEINSIKFALIIRFIEMAGCFGQTWKFFSCKGRKNANKREGKSIKRLYIIF